VHEAVRGLGFESPAGGYHQGGIADMSDFAVRGRHGIHYLRTELSKANVVDADFVVSMPGVAVLDEAVQFFEGERRQLVIVAPPEDVADPVGGEPPRAVGQIAAVEELDLAAAGLDIDTLVGRDVRRSGRCVILAMDEEAR
jgi:hypothetical protein